MSSPQPTSTISDLGSSVADAHQFYVQQLEQKIQYEREKNARLMSELFQRDMQIEQQRKRIRASAARESRQLKNKRRPPRGLFHFGL